MTNALSQLAAIAERAASAARDVTPSSIDEKGLHDFVTDTDRSLQRDITAALQKSFPNVPVFGEEGIAPELRLPDRAFLIDPLDGTGNWIAGLPFSAVSIAYLEEGDSVLATVAAIAGDGVYTAELGKGAWRDGKRIRVTGPPQPLIALSSGVLDAVQGSTSYGALRRFGKIRNLGSQALQLCGVGRGNFAFNASLEARLWDDAAGRLIASEAGAIYRATVAAAEERRPAARQHSLCAHPHVFEEVSTILEPVFAMHSN